MDKEISHPYNEDLPENNDNDDNLNDTKEAVVEKETSEIKEKHKTDVINEELDEVQS